MKSANKKSELKNIEKSKKKFIFYKPNMFKTKDFQIHMEKNSLYENINFIYSNEKNQYDFFEKYTNVILKKFRSQEICSFN